MMCDNTLMSVDNSSSPFKQENSKSPSSWFEIVSREEKEQKKIVQPIWNVSAMAETEDANSSPIKLEPTCKIVIEQAIDKDLLGFKGNFKQNEAKPTTEMYENRDIKIELLDVKNEDKFDKLIVEEKLKTPFKRRMSNTSNNSMDSNKSDDKNTPIKKMKASDDLKPEKARTTSSCSGSTNSSLGTRRKERETNDAILERRQKQINYGKNTIGYDNYIKDISKKNRKPEHPTTPIKDIKYSRRAWDGLIKIWRKKLHCWDPAQQIKNEDTSDDDSDSD